MTTPHTTHTLYYCYDAYCGWCYGNSKVIQQVAQQYGNKVHIEVLSGGMVRPATPTPISATAEYIRNAYPRVEEYTGVTFGTDYLWHINNPELSDWYPDSTKPAIAMCIFKEQYAYRQVEFAVDLQQALYGEGRDLCDNEAYRHILEKYELDVTTFYNKLASDVYKQQALQEFEMCTKLQVRGFPSMYLRATTGKYYEITNGYTSYDATVQRLTAVLAVH